jgi:hypothetical protein
MDIEKSIDYRNKKSYHLFTVHKEINPYTIEGLYYFIEVLNEEIKFTYKKKYKKFVPLELSILKEVFYEDSVSAYIFYDKRMNEDYLVWSIYELVFRKMGNLAYMGQKDDQQ